jgi:hypothetical protein
MLISSAAWAGSEGNSDKSNADAGIAAYVGGKPITMAELDAKALKTNMKLAQSLYDARQAALDDLIMERLLADEAAAQGISTDALLAKRLAEKAAPVTDAEVESFYNGNKARMGGKSLAEMSARIREHLVSQRQGAARKTVLRDLKKNANVRTVIEPPRAEIKLAANERMQGPPGAQVTIIEYVDFQ